MFYLLQVLSLSLQVKQNDSTADANTIVTVIVTLLLLLIKYVYFCVSHVGSLTVLVWRVVFHPDYI
jgi:hypothetical protein